MALSQNHLRVQQRDQSLTDDTQRSEGFSLDGVEMTTGVPFTARPKIVDSQFSEYESSGFLHQLLGGSPSWLTSMIVHLVVLLTLALWTVNATRKAVVRLEMDANDYALLTELEDLNIDAVALQTDSDSQSMLETREDVVNEFQPDLQLNEIAEVPLGIEDPLGGEASQLGRLTEELNSRVQTLGDGRSSFFGIEMTGQSVVYIVDLSGSMGGQRWEDAVGEILKSVRALNSDQKFYVYLFNHVLYPMDLGLRVQKTELYPANERNKKGLEKWLKMQQPHGGSDPVGAFERALQFRPDTIFLLTDGQFPDNTDAYLIFAAELQKMRTSVGTPVINTIGFSVTLADKMMLNEIASIYNGTYVDVR